MDPFLLPAQGPGQREPQARVRWIIWIAITALIPVYQFVLGKGLPGGPNAPTDGISPILILAASMILIATVVRWIVLPRAKDTRQLLVAMIIGLALSESVEFYGLFLFPASQPQTKLSLFLLSLLSCMQFIPLYANSKPRA